MSADAGPTGAARFGVVGAGSPLRAACQHRMVPGGRPGMKPGGFGRCVASSRTEERTTRARIRLLASPP
ncbi:hypothetical protein PSMK_15710 [Phycisphaera mikurensis NBRC 102666]|uniref:Uncharacterized protein n=1 Tax=Phycisphaera mikurensis (strain NBRC 102666 / KCTC 22515 / FYK2301M01) TaxID=1142394 RepID=I0IEP2_PHYMF|nr:hypothetical protein PSMK_15710 [Phycisphaera mikurensis NBRC 102666]